MAKTVSIRKLRHYWPIYLFIVPSLVLVALFKYYTAASAVYHSFFRWDGDTIRRFVGLAHFRKYLGEPALWGLTLALLLLIVVLGERRTRFSAVVKFLGGILAPLVNALVFATRGAALTANFGWTVGVLLLGATLYAVPRLRSRGTPSLGTLQALAGMGVVVWSLAIHAGGDATLWRGFGVVAVLVVANVFKLIPSVLTAVVIHRLVSDRANYWYRVLFVVPMIIPGMVNLLLWKFFFEPTGVLNLILEKTGLLALLGRLDVWLGWGGVFAAGARPLWLGSAELVLPAIILWGFPWVGVIGVLIYLAGLQSIDRSVYEAAEVDGVGSFGKFLYIELPLILTQIRITLILMIIGTLQSYEQILVLFGDAGGPQGKLLIPGLYMFRNAFVEGRAGEACCIGLIIFVFILILTEINNRFVKVEK